MVDTAINALCDESMLPLFRKLSRAFTLLLGIDPIVVMTDIAGGIRGQALDGPYGARGRSPTRRYVAVDQTDR
jgi:hypothetical protein